jgi:hypothetical protein
MTPTDMIENKTTNIYVAGHREKESGAICNDDPMLLTDNSTFPFGSDLDRDRVALSEEGLVNAYTDGQSGEIIVPGYQRVIVATSPFIRSRQTNTQRLLGAGYNPLDVETVDTVVMDQLGFHEKTFTQELWGLFEGKDPLADMMKGGFYFQGPDNVFCYSQLAFQVLDAVIEQYEKKVLPATLNGVESINFGTETHSDSISAFWAGLFLEDRYSVDESKKEVTVPANRSGNITLFKRPDFVKARIVGGDLSNPVFALERMVRGQETPVDDTTAPMSLDQLKMLRDELYRHSQIKL